MLLVQKTRQLSNIDFILFRTLTQLFGVAKRAPHFAAKTRLFLRFYIMSYPVKSTALAVVSAHLGDPDGTDIRVSNSLMTTYVCPTATEKLEARRIKAKAKSAAARARAVDAAKERAD